MTSTKLLSLLLIIVAVTIEVTAYQRRTVCNKNSPRRCRPNSPAVCGFFEDGCPYGRCQQDYPNKCEACKDSKVLFHTPGICQQITSSCDLIDIPEVCPEIYEPVCAALRECEGEGCSRTFPNGCFACAKGGYNLFKEGRCPGEELTTYCELVDIPEVCPEIYDPVCARLRDCQGTGCTRTFSNLCFACAEGGYNEVNQGECPAEESPTLYCELIDIPEVCPQVYEPVCARLRDCQGTDCTRTFSNTCFACAEGGYNEVNPGRCPDEELTTTYCELIDIPEVCPEIYDPVCARLRDCEGDDCTQTFSNTCFACAEGGYNEVNQGPCQN